jgi:hypothetical protein
LLAGNKGWGNGGSVYISGGNGGAGAGGAGHIVLNTGNDASVGPGLIMMRINGTEALRINSSRNVGMGLANPTAMLHIKGGSAGQPGKIKIEDADPTGLSSLELINNAGNTFYFYKLSSGYPANGRYTQGVSMIESNNANGLTLSEVTGDIHFYTGGNNERLTINNSGNIGIGTITPGAKLEVNGQVKITGGTPGAGKVLTSDAAGLASWQATGYAITHYIGESYGGGIVFYVYDNGQHGLIAATSDQSSSMRWNGGTNTNTMAYSDGIGAGKSNTAILIGNQGYGDGATYAARLCNEYSINVSGVIYSDWYLPSKTELNLLYLQKVIVGGFGGGNYWSSTEASITNCWGQTFSSGIQDSFGKADLYSVRAIRSF